MTLLFSYIDDNYVMHLADERVTRWNKQTRDWDIVDDHTAKQILIRGSTIISFTGPIAIDGETPTTEWLARRLSDPAVPIENAIDEASQRLTVVFERMRFRNQCLTYVIGGWATRSDSEQLQPVYGEITNQNPGTYERLPEFTAWFSYLPHGGHWSTRGQRLPADVETALRRQIGHALNAGISPPVLQRLFLDAMRATARQNRAVGPSALIGVLPRAAMEYAQHHPDDFFVVGSQQGAVIPGAAMFVRVPAGEDRTVPYTPLIV